MTIGSLVSTGVKPEKMDDRSGIAALADLTFRPSTRYSEGSQIVAHVTSWLASEGGWFRQ